MRSVQNATIFLLRECIPSRISTEKIEAMEKLNHSYFITTGASRILLLSEVSSTIIISFVVEIDKISEQFIAHTTTETFGVPCILNERIYRRTLFWRSRWLSHLNDIISFRTDIMYFYRPDAIFIQIGSITIPYIFVSMRSGDSYISLIQSTRTCLAILI